MQRGRLCVVTVRWAAGCTEVSMNLVTPFGTAYMKTINKYAKPGYAVDV